MTHTTNYNLSKFESSDTVESAVSAFNDNMDIIDSALGGYGLNRLEASDTVENAVSAFNDNMDTIDSAMGSGGTILPKTITANGTYNASADSADGYSPVTVNVPQPAVNPVVFGATLSDYSVGNMDLTNGWYVSDTPTNMQADTVTIDGVTYSGLKVTPDNTIKTSKNFDTVLQTLEFEFIISALTQTTTRIISTGSPYWTPSLWYNNNSIYLQYTLGWQGITVVDGNIVSHGDGNFHDTSITMESLVDAVLNVKFALEYRADSPKIAMWINGVKKCYWDYSVIQNAIKTCLIAIGGNGVQGTDMLITKCEWRADGILYNGHRYALVD